MGHGESSFGSGSGDGSQRQRVVKKLGTQISAIQSMIKGVHKKYKIFGEMCKSCC